MRRSRYGVEYLSFLGNQEGNLIPVGDKTLLSKNYIFNCIVRERLFLPNVMGVDSKAVVII